MKRNYIKYGGIIDFEENHLDQQTATTLYSLLETQVEWEQKYYTNWKTKEKFPQPRLTAWYADSPNMTYSYSGVTQKVQPWLPDLLKIKKEIELLVGTTYNSVLLNFYRDGKDSVGSHADDEKELGTNANIASVSLGSPRIFELACYKHSKDLSICNVNEEDKDYYEWLLTNGSLMIMSGTTQHYWKHSIPKDSFSVAGRINLTFRKFNM